MEIETNKVADLMSLDVNNLDRLTSTHYKRGPFSSGNHYVSSLRHSTSLLWRLLVDGAAFFFSYALRVCSQALTWRELENSRRGSLQHTLRADRINDERKHDSKCIVVPEPAQHHSGLARVSQGLAAVRDFNPAKDRSGSTAAVTGTLATSLLLLGN